MKKILLQITCLSLLLVSLTGTIVAQSTPFITVWDSNQPSSRTNNSNTTIALNFIGDNYTIEWQGIDDPSQSGTVTVTSSTQTNPYILTVPVAGKYRIKAYSLKALFSGDYVQVNNIPTITTHDPQKLITVESWGNTVWVRLNSAFQGAENMNVTATDIPVLTSVSDMGNMFRGCKNLVYNNTINNWNVSTITNFAGMFIEATKFNQPLNSWTVTSAINMSFMFKGATSFNQPLNNWNVATVTNMRDMFYDASVFNQPLNSWNTSKVENMAGMFCGAVRFNSTINDWDVSKVTNMSAMFQGAATFNQPLDKWVTSSVMNTSAMFRNAVKFNQPLATFITVNDTTMDAMFLGAAAFNQPIGNWQTGNVINMRNVFSAAGSFNQDISSWNTSKVKTMSGMFSSAIVFNQPIGGWNTENVENMYSMFNNAIAFNQDISTWNTGKVKDMSYMFNKTKVFNQNISGWNTENVENMSYMFNSAAMFNQPIGQWNTGKVKDMSNMFSSTARFNSPIGSWNTASVTNMKSMFNGAQVFNQDISGWNTSEVTDMSEMFSGATFFNQNIGNWDVAKVKNMTRMFYNTKRFNQNLGNWKLQSLTTAKEMFFATAMNCVNYSASIVGWAKHANIASNVELGAAALVYNRNGLAAHNYLTQVKGWTITGDPVYQRECAAGETAGDFISVWNSQTTSERHNNTTQDIAIHALGTNYSLEWIRLDPNDFSETSDRGIITNVSGSIGNPYIIKNLPAVGQYRIRLFPGIGTLDGFYLDDQTGTYDYNRLIKIEQWGTNVWTKLSRAFYKTRKMEVVATDKPNLSGVEDLSFMFAQCDIMQYSDVIGTWDVSNIKVMASMFEGTKVFNRSLNSWNVSNVTDMNAMFRGALEYNQPFDRWDVSKVTNMNAMFKTAIKFNQNLGSWDLRSIVDAQFMLDNDLETNGMDCLNYSATINGWAANPNTPDNIVCGALRRVYNRKAKAAHVKLDDDKNWSFITDTYEANCGGLSFVWIGTVSENMGDPNNWDDKAAPEEGGNVEFATTDNHTGEALRDMRVDGPNRIIGNLINNSSKKTIIDTDISLTVQGTVTGSETMDKAYKIEIRSAENKPNGTLILAGQAPAVPVYGTVQMYSRAKKGASQTWVDNIEGSPTHGKEFTTSYQWQHFGIPVESVTANDFLYKAYARRYDETYNGDNTKFFQKWRSVTTYETMTAFTGYEITQETPATYVAQGKLNFGDKNLVLTRRAPAVTGASNPDQKINHWGLGQNIFGNSYTASIQIDKIVFPTEVEKTVYIYNTGSFAEWANNSTTSDATDIPGAYLAIPQNVAPAIFFNRIPSMQGFMLKFTEAATIYGGTDAVVTLKYNNGGVERNGRPQKSPVASEYAEESNDTVEANNEIGYMRVGLQGETSADIMWIIEMPNTTDGFDNGYDGYKMMSMTSSATIFTDSKDGQLQVSTSHSVLNKPFSFRSNSAGEYKLTLVKSNLGHYNNLHLVDMVADKYVSLNNDSTVYVFTSDNVDKIEKRFMIVNESPTTGVDITDNPYLESLDAYMSDNHTLVVNNMTTLTGTVSILDVSGRTVLSRDMHQGFSQIPVSLTSGVYMISLQTAKNTKMVKVIIK